MRFIPVQCNVIILTVTSSQSVSEKKTKSPVIYSKVEAQGKM